MSAELHIIPVPPGYTAQQAWEEIETMGGLAGWRWWHRFTRRPAWAVVATGCDDEELDILVVDQGFEAWPE